MRHTESRLALRDGTHLALRTRTPAASPVGTIVIAHGLGEHAGRYQQLADDMTAAGYVVRAADHRGHGASPGARGAMPAATSMREDVLEALAAARVESPAPVILLGHSMGGAMAAWAIAQQPSAADALILSSPSLLANLTPVHKALMHTMRRLARVRRGCPGSGRFGAALRGAASRDLQRDRA